MENLTGLQPITIENVDSFSVLVVEDNLNEQLVLHYLLRQQIQGVLPVGATSIQQALSYLKNCHTRHQALPTLILVDLYLPCRGDGWKLLRKLRSHRIYRSIPIAVVGSSTDLKDIEQSYFWGANSYITKPVSLEGWQEILPAIPRLMTCR